MDHTSAIMHTVNAIGNSLDRVSAHAILVNLRSQNVISTEAAQIMNAAINDRAFSGIPQENRDALRAAILKNMLMTQV